MVCCAMHSLHRTFILPLVPLVHNLSVGVVLHVSFWSRQVACSQLPLKSLLFSEVIFQTSQLYLKHSNCLPQIPWLHMEQALNNQKSLAQMSECMLGVDVQCLFQLAWVIKRQISSCESIRMSCLRMKEAWVPYHQKWQWLLQGS